MIETVRRDSHSRRSSRPYGFTIHIDEGCKALLYSLLLNPRFEVGRSFVAIGSVYELLNFLEYTKERDLLQRGSNKSLERIAEHTDKI